MFLKGVLGYLPVQLVQAIAGFGALVVFTRLLSPADYGTYALAFSVAALAQTLGLTWIEAAMARFYVAERERGDVGALYGSLYRAFAVSAAAVVGFGALLLAVLPVTAALRFAIGAGLVSVVFRSLLKLAQERRRAAGEVRGFAVFDMLQTGGGFLLGVLLAWAGFGAAAPLAGAGAASAVCLVWAFPSEAALARRGRLDRARLKGYAAFGLPVSLSLVMSLALAVTDRFVLAAFIDTAAVGAYHAGYSLSSRTLDILFLWLGMAGHPAAVAALERGGEAALRASARQQASLMLLIAVPAAAGLALVSRPLAMLMVGPELAAQAARVTPWIAVGALFSGLTTHYLHMSFTLSRRTRLQLAAVAVPAGLNLVLTLALIPRFGLDGALWATAASYGVGLVAAFVLMQRSLPLPVPWTTLGQVVAATGLMTAVVLLLPSPGGLAEILLKAGVGALAYALAALALDAGGSRSQGLGWAIRVAQEERGVTLTPKAWTVDNRAWTPARPALSVLIPFLRDDPSPLLRLLEREAAPLGGAVELIALDDGGDDDALAERVAGLVGGLSIPARFIRLPVNQGRARARNRLAADARGGHYLFLDSDMAPDSSSFLQAWLELVRGGDPALAFGGFSLDQTPRTREHALHRAVSLLADCRPASVRAREPEKLLCSSNLLVRADVFGAEAFDEGFQGWGWEDVEWAARVSRRWPVLHVDNTASHLGLDTDRALLAKYEQSPANFARLAAKHPEKVAAFPSYRLARRLQPLPGRRRLQALARSAALAGVLPARLRALAAKLYRAFLYAEVIG